MWVVGAHNSTRSIFGVMLGSKDDCTNHCVVETSVADHLAVDLVVKEKGYTISFYMETVRTLAAGVRLEEIHV